MRLEPGFQQCRDKPQSAVCFAKVRNPCPCFPSLILRDAYAGIDVAFSKGKRLPVCVTVHEEERLVPLRLRSSAGPQPPHGRGNRGALDPFVVSAFARASLDYLRAVEEREEIRIRTIAIDAPRTPRRPSIERRAAERAMYERGIHFFATPSREEFDGIVQEARQYLDSGGALTHLPNANRLWMRVGFELFEVLADRYECIEVFPHAIAVAFGASSVPKATHAGLHA